MVVLKLAKGNKSGGCFWARAQAQAKVKEAGQEWQQSIWPRCV